MVNTSKFSELENEKKTKKNQLWLFEDVKVKEGLLVKEADFETERKIFKQRNN